MRQKFSGLMIVLALGVAFSAPLSAQQPREPMETSARTMDVDDDDSRFDAGWLGLLGLAGMMGMRRREVHAVRTDSAHATGR